MGVMSRQERYRLLEEDENGSDLPVIGCIECPGVVINDLGRHHEWHIEREAAADPNQASLFG